MENNDIKKTMEFILEHQAKFTIDMESLKESMNIFKEAMLSLKDSIEIIKDNQDKLTTNLNKFIEHQISNLENQKKQTARLSRLEESFVLLVDLARNNDDRMDIISQQITELSAINKENINNTNKQIAELTKSQINTDERINILIKMFERFMS